MQKSQGLLFTNRPLSITHNLNAMKSPREETPSPRLSDINDSTFIAPSDTDEFNNNEKLHRMRI